MNPLIQKISAKCIEANPDKEAEWNIDGSKLDPQPIRLADVLLAMRGHSGHAIDQDGLFIRIVPRDKYGWDPIEGFVTPPVWNFYKDDLEEQSPETLQFISQVLGV